MVPSVYVVDAVVVLPFSLVEIELNDVVELHLGVPASIDVQLVVVSEETVSSSAIWGVVGWDNLLPSFGFKIKAVKIVVSNS